MERFEEERRVEDGRVWGWGVGCGSVQRITEAHPVADEIRSHRPNGQSQRDDRAGVGGGSRVRLRAQLASVPVDGSFSASVELQVRFVVVKNIQ